MANSCASKNVMISIRGVQVAILLGSYFGPIWSKIPEKFVVTWDEHKQARQKVISTWLA